MPAPPPLGRPVLAVKKFSAGGWRVVTVSRQPFSALCPWPGGDKNHVQIDLADSADVKRLPLEPKGRRTRHDANTGNGREGIDQLLRHALAEVILVALGAHVPERQHGNRRHA